MKNAFTALTFFCALFMTVSAQEKNLRPQSLGVSFIMNDFKTADRIRTSSLSAVFRDKKWSKFSEMSPGFAVTYFKGLTPYVDFAGTFSFSGADGALKVPGSSALLLDADASVNAKLLTDNYWMSPYFSAGVGASKFANYYAAFLPLGIGVNVNLFNEGGIFLGTQYRIPVTEAASYHFMYSIGIHGVIGKKN